MRNPLRLMLTLIACTLASPGVVWGAPITFRASGQVESIFDSNDDPAAPLLLDAISVGTPWRLDVTFDPATPGNVFSGMPTSFWYADAMSAATFTLGEFTYTNTLDGVNTLIGTNIGWPVGGGPDNVGVAGQGLVQFQFSGGWIGGSGGPNLNAGLGLLIASWNDVNAVDGSLPMAPALALQQAVLAGLLFDTFTGVQFRAWFTSDFRPEVVEAEAIPEPASLLLLSAGIAAVAVRVRRRRGGRRQVQ